jgi:hypothetical protein
MARINTYLSILRMNVNDLNFPIKRQRLASWIKEEDQMIFLFVYKKHISTTETNIGL